MKKIILILFVIAIVILGFFGIRFYNKYIGNNVAKEGFVLIPHRAAAQQILDSISPYIKNKDYFKSVAEEKKLSQNYRAGRYEMKSGMSNREIVNMILAGNQTPNSFRIKDFDDVYQMLGRVTKKTEIDSATFANELNKIAIRKGYKNAEDLKKYFFNNTYEFFWTVTPTEFFEKFETEYKNFWTAERIEKEKRSGLTRDQIYALASIVYRESGGKPDEQKTIAGLYLNRYRKGMKLQSDPTVIYAINKASNFSRKIKRLYYKDLTIESPYNTYANKGIPPGPICIVDKSSLNAVLDADDHHYIFMCADPEKPGYHKFTDNAAEHALNAKAYQEWLDRKEIK
ncbi:endolytic transglycosylase MltG [Chryseobacterium sp. SC28]|uniref:endolytic transglycosylase MltG n=1 Tax=Chryseobacterium sp. SC28 TaxID=2268028 RepID=UPI000F64ADEC|nr:endolytic transglycosylase MltG [Chryseobacterium sp. SC28]RRQ45435.1 endolytic transglycosylase MltG [Chryseobacterium sp. SC28]